MRQHWAENNKYLLVLRFFVLISNFTWKSTMALTVTLGPFSETLTTHELVTRDVFLPLNEGMALNFDMVMKL